MSEPYLSRPTPALRWVLRNGVSVLQQGWECWRNVPVAKAWAEWRDVPYAGQDTDLPSDITGADV